MTEFREVSHRDHAFLKERLRDVIIPYSPQDRHYAIFEKSFHDGAFDAYVDGWGRDGDFGIVGSDGQTPHSAAWYRNYPETMSAHFPMQDPKTPEIVMSVASSFRGQGVGRAVLTKLLQEAAYHNAGYLCLTVNESNAAAMRLYSSVGFAITESKQTLHLMRIDAQRINPDALRSIVDQQIPSSQHATRR